MAVDDALLSLIENIYDAALETLWPTTLKRLITATDAHAATFWILDSGSGEPKLPTFTYINLDRQLIEEYLDYMAPQDPTCQYIVAHTNERIIHDASFITEREKDRHPYYDWHHRYTDMRNRIVGMIHPAPTLNSGIALHRARGKGDFHPASIERFTALYPHIERALQIGFRLGTIATMQQVSMDMLDRNPRAIMFLDSQGSVIFANHAARDLAQSADGLIVTSQAVCFVRQTDNEKLQRLIAKAMNPAMNSAPGGAMSALRPSGKRPYSIVVSPLPHGSFSMSKLRPAVCVGNGVQTEQLRAVYGLTPSEARLATRLAEGVDLQSAAASLNIGYPTAGTQLAIIFRKTETRRQGELVKLLLTAIPPHAS
jgi:DNA-binding CsgD family transcriptional regulator